MTAKLDTINTQLPTETVAAVRCIAKLAGVKPETVIKIAIAMECARWEKVRESQP